MITFFYKASRALLSPSAKSLGTPGFSNKQNFDPEIRGKGFPGF